MDKNALHIKSCKIVSWCTSISSTGRKERLLWHPLFCWANDTAFLDKATQLLWNPFSSSNNPCFYCSSEIFKTISLVHVHMWFFKNVDYQESVTRLLLSTTVIFRRNSGKRIRWILAITQEDDRCCRALTRTWTSLCTPRVMGPPRLFTQISSYWWCYVLGKKSRPSLGCFLWLG